MRVTRKTKAILSLVSLFLFSGLALFVAVTLFFSGLAGADIFSSENLLVMIISMIPAVLCYIFMLLSIALLMTRHRLKDLLVWEKINIVVLLLMFSPIAGAIGYTLFLIRVVISNFFKGAA